MQYSQQKKKNHKKVFDNIKLQYRENISEKWEERKMTAQEKKNYLIILPTIKEK